MSEDETRACRIERRAYLIWERENRPDGLHLDHWRRAEAEIAREEAAHPATVSEPSAGDTSDPLAEVAKGRAASPAAPERKDPPTAQAG